MKAYITLLFIFLMLQAPLTLAQDRIPIRIIVEDLTDQPCGLTPEAIEGRTKLTLRQYGFTEATYSNPHLYIAINSLELGQQCVGELTVEVKGFTAQDFGDGKLGWVSKAKERATVLASSGSIFIYARYQFPARALDSVEAHVKRTLSQIEY